MVAWEVEVELLLVDLMLLGRERSSISAAFLFSALFFFRCADAFVVFVFLVACCSFCFARNGRMRYLLVGGAMMLRSLVVE